MQGLACKDLKPLALPVDIIQRKLRHLLGAQAVGKTKKGNGMAEPSSDRPSLHRLSHVANFIQGSATGHCVLDDRPATFVLLR